ncbi:MAG: FtsX-like permease family protein [Bacteroidales bacterium]|nr:FtsX-like permease family protein [Clostridium sp.]MCM1203525.1 FtsX-like permease family protein [Bacteroidales bacterium]
MLTFIKQKLLHKKWLNFCLLIGIIVLVAVASCLPMYQDMAKNQTFQNIMKKYIQDNQKYPALITFSGGLTVKDGADAYAGAVKTAEEYGKKLEDIVKLSAGAEVRLLTLKEDTVIPLINAGKSKGAEHYRIAYLKDMEQHMNLVSGKLYRSKAEVEENGEPEEGVVSLNPSSVYTCVVSAALLEDSRFYVGQTLEFKKLLLKNGQPLRITITGVFEEKEAEDSYWVQPPSVFLSHFFVSEEMFKEIAADLDGDVTARYQCHELYDYKNLKASRLPGVDKAVKNLLKIGLDGEKVNIETDFSSLLEEYMEIQGRISSTLWVLELPIVVLILVFIYMISAQLLELEGNEIATLKSRGASIRQITGLYFGQSVILAATGTVVGLPLGYVLCRLLGQANAFLEFVNRPNLTVHITGTTILYCILAVVFAVGFMTLPLFGIAREDIVEKKSRRGKTDKGVVEKYYLDVVILGISGYAYYSFNSQRAELTGKILNGENMDPFLFLSATLFMLGLGMVLLRLFRLVTAGIYRLGRKKWSPAMYASFLQIMRTRGKQGFISLFLIVAIAMGIFYSNVARTINQNEEERAYYDIGADIVVEEEWIKMSHSTMTAAGERKTTFYYVEPDTNLIKDIAENAMAATKVIRREEGTLKGKNNLTDNGQMMAIQTKEFGTVAWMREDALAQHWFYYLNDLADNAENVLVSANVAEDFGLKIGDTITYSPVKNEDSLWQDTLSSITGTICGFVDAWPGYTGYKSVVDENGVKTQEPVYLVIYNYAYVESCCGQQPCFIWARTGGNNEGIYEKIAGGDTGLIKIQDAEKQLALVKQSALVQITNGMLTLSFLVVLALCAIGFLIYWITSIRQRELLFGIYRAMGMSMQEVLRMLLNEQVFCSVIAVLCGVVSGIATSKIFISLITIAYSPESHCLEFKLYSSPFDMVRIGAVVILMLGVCVSVLWRIIAKMKIAQALKLGED